MKRYAQSAVSVLCLLLTFVAVTLFVPSFARAARLLWDEQSAAVQDGVATEVTVEDFGAVGDGVHDDSEAIENALNSGAAKVEFGAGKTYLYKKAIVMTASNVEIAGNGATLEWDSETPFEDWRELRIVGWEPDTPVTNIRLRHLNFLTPNMSDEQRVSSVQLILFNCSDVLVEDCGFLITEGRGNGVNADGGRGATNIWIYGECHNVTVQNCSLRNLSHASGGMGEDGSYLGAGGNIWVSGYCAAGTAYTSITDISILNNRIEKSCHDESITVWSADAERILIDGNEFDMHEKEDGITEYSDMVFTFGNLEGCEEGKPDTVKGVHFTHNTVRAESGNYLFLCGGGEGSEPVDISGNDIRTKVGSMNGTPGLVHTGSNLCDVVFQDNRVLLENSGDSGELYRLFNPRRNKVVGNTVTVNRQFAHICDLDGDAAQQKDTSTFENNHFIINTANLGNYLYQGYDFHGNTVEFNAVFPNSVFTFYETAFSRKTANLSGNRIIFRGVFENVIYGRPALTIGNCTMNGCVVDISGNEFYTTVPQSGDEAYVLVSVSGLTDGDVQTIRATNVRSNLFDQLWFDEVSAVRVITDAGEYSAWARLPLTESVAAVLSDGALSYAVTGPELSEVSLFAVCYDNDGRMLSCAAPELAAPDSGVPWARGEISLASLFTPEAAADAQTVRLFLLKSDTPSPVCKPWNLSA